MNTTLIRNSNPNDTDSVYSLLCIIAELHKNGRPDMFPDLISKYTPQEVYERLSKDENGVFVAEQDGRVVGYVFCDIIKEGNGLTLYIDDLCVDENCRGKHIGTKLFDFVKAYAKDIGCYNVTLNVWACNPGSLKFYEKCGMQVQKMGMEWVL